jgi:hypothetical protein
VEQGLIGFGFYAWMMVGLFRLSRRNNAVHPAFRRVWPILLVVYLLNATFVVINYQFVNALLFTIGGILAGHNRSQIDEC